MATEALRIGTRGSRLAMWQAEHIRDLLLAAVPGVRIELRIIRVLGDQILDRPLAEVGGKGLFVKEIEQALLDDEVDVAVHSLKDLPVDQPEGLFVAAYPPRADPFDVLCPTRAGEDLQSLPMGARIGTSSLRRGAQLRAERPDCEPVVIRGNVETRLGKRFDGALRLDAVVLAAAGLHRLGRWEPGFVPLRPPQFVPAPAQGILAIETRRDDARAIRAAQLLDNAEARLAATAERACLREIGGDCKTPFGAWADVQGSQIILQARLLDPDGRRTDATAATSREPEGALRAASLGSQVGKDLLARHAHG